MKNLEETISSEFEVRADRFLLNLSDHEKSKLHDEYLKYLFETSSRIPFIDFIREMKKEELL